MKKAAVIASLLWFTASANAQVMAMFTGRQLQMGYNKLNCEYIYNGQYFYISVSGYYCPPSVEI
jgi:hypothetical protein